MVKLPAAVAKVIPARLRLVELMTIGVPAVP